MSFQVAAEDSKEGIITQFGSCFHVAAAELVFSVQLEVLRTEKTNTIHGNDAVLGLV